LLNKGAEPPKNSAHVYCGQTAGWIKMALRMEEGYSTDDFVLDGDYPDLLKEKGGGAEPPTQFSAHFYYSQMAGCIKMPLSIAVGLSPGDFVLHGDPAPLPKKEAELPNFRAISLVAKWLHGSRCHSVWR